MANLSGIDIGRYHILAPLGEGGMATVYKAFDTRLQREVAVKVIRKDAFTPDLLAMVLQRFEREALTLARLTHPNIIPVYDYGEYENSPFLVMPYLPGGTLKERIGGPMQVREAAALLLPVARALQYAHEQNVLHRDIKPSNILLTQGGQPMLGDFGIAKLLEQGQGATLTGTGVGIGTPEYMAPEAGLGEAVAASDQYSLGVVFYELVTGRKPYYADTPFAVMLKHINDPLPAPGSFVPGLPPAVEQVLFTALAKQPQHRYASVADFAQALGQLAQPPGLSTVPDSPAVRRPPQPAPLPYPANSPAQEEQVQPDQNRNQSAAAEAIELAGETSAHRAVEDAARRAGNEQEVKKTGVPTWKWQAAAAGIIVIVVLIIAALFWRNSSDRQLQAEMAASISATQDVLSQQATASSATQTAFLLLPTATARVVVLSPTSPPPTAIAAPSATPGNTPPTCTTIGQTWISPIDGMTLVCVPAGKFLMGAMASDWDAEIDERPQHEVTLDAFWIDRTEVTNRQFQLFAQATGYKTDAEKKGSSTFYDGSSWKETPGVNWKQPKGIGSDLSERWEFPVVHVSWSDAKTYCEWAKRSLPTEAQWEKAARGGDTRLYSWGNAAPDATLLNFNMNIKDAVEVGKYPKGASPYGAFDMAGNVWEWVADWYADNFYSLSSASNPTGPDSGQKRVMRGGSWYYDAKGIRSTNRVGYPPSTTNIDDGFRCSR